MSPNNDSPLLARHSCAQSLKESREMGSFMMKLPNQRPPRTHFWSRRGRLIQLAAASEDARQGTAGGHGRGCYGVGACAGRV